MDFICLKLVFLTAILLAITPTSAVWMCQVDEDCSTLDGGVCLNNKCGCPVGFQMVENGRRCVEAAPYHFSKCVEDFQCSRLFNGFQCFIDENSAFEDLDDATKKNTEGKCRCLPGHHYFLGRCWLTRDLGEDCSRDEECHSPVLINPFSMQCQEGTCVCSDGYFLRQRGECRKSGREIGASCVIDVDCQFPNGVCDFRTFTCYDSTVGVPGVPTNNNVTREQMSEDSKMAALSDSKMAALPDSKMADASQHTTACRDNDDCEAPFVCSALNICTCPIGFYSDDGRECSAEIGSPATEESCRGMFAVVQNDICTCPNNFFAEESMRDCVKVTARFGHSCIRDAMCLTFGAASVCGPPGQWELRTCECIPGLAVQETHNSLCRLFSAIGELCEEDSDCMAGNVEIECRLEEESGDKRCTCPDGLYPVGNLCLAAGLYLGEPCQVTEECTGTEHTVCEGGYCSCDDGFGQSGNYCLPVIGSVCARDDDCIIGNTTCQEYEGVKTCQCKEEFVVDHDECWPISFGFEQACALDSQCAPTLGDGSKCEDDVCTCVDSFHYRDGYCWPKTGLRETCSRSSMCFLGEYTDRVVCRNSRCECDFEYPYDELLNICTRSYATNISGSIFILVTIFTTQLFVIKNYFRI